MPKTGMVGKEDAWPSRSVLDHREFVVDEGDLPNKVRSRDGIPGEDTPMLKSVLVSPTGELSKKDKVAKGFKVGMLEKSSL